LKLDFVKRKKVKEVAPLREMPGFGYGKGIV
jgi:hypothetical protein